MDSIRWMRPAATHVAWSVCVSVYACWSRAKTDKPIEMSQGGSSGAASGY